MRRIEGRCRGGTFVGQHIYTTRPGVAVQINAFNFPVWGMLEKLAPAFLAGVPSIIYGLIGILALAPWPSRRELAAMRRVQRVVHEAERRRLAG